MERIKEFLKYEPDTGKFFWVKNNLRDKTWHSNFEGKEAGSLKPSGYINIHFEYKRYQAHKLAWYFMTGEWPDKDVDHIDRIRNNNKWDNLSLASKQQNRFNSICPVNSISGVKGVSFIKRLGKWKSRITYEGKTYSLGCHLTMEEAKEAYETKAKELHGEFYNSNTTRILLDSHNT